jgi:hypothetical protein
MTSTAGSNDRSNTRALDLRLDWANVDAHAVMVVRTTDAMPSLVGMNASSSGGL